MKAYNDANRLYIEIKDNGIGMENSVKERAFEMFYRGNEFSQGIGLGLFKIKNIVDRVKGEIRL
ncbi:MAG: sensor histidine kinase [Cytophagales bacterium]|nr:sensor histidine kinase [Cytophagales bacterium]